MLGDFSIQDLISMKIISRNVKILQCIHRNERMDYEVLNKRLDTQEDLIHSIIHELTIDLGKALLIISF